MTINIDTANLPAAIAMLRRSVESALRGVEQMRRDGVDEETIRESGPNIQAHLATPIMLQLEQVAFDAGMDIHTPEFGRDPLLRRNSV